jgi:hypothetical protein
MCSPAVGAATAPGSSREDRLVALAIPPGVLLLGVPLDIGRQRRAADALEHGSDILLARRVQPHRVLASPELLEDLELERAPLHVDPLAGPQLVRGLQKRLGLGTTAPQQQTLHAPAALAPTIEPMRQHPRFVEHDPIPGPQEPRQVPHDRVLEQRPIRATTDQQPRRIPRLHRLLRDPRRIELIVKIAALHARDHAPLSVDFERNKASCRAAGRIWSMTQPSFPNRCPHPSRRPRGRRSPPRRADEDLSPRDFFAARPQRP